MASPVPATGQGATHETAAEHAASLRAELTDVARGDVSSTSTNNGNLSFQPKTFQRHFSAGPKQDGAAAGGDKAARRTRSVSGTRFAPRMLKHHGFTRLQRPRTLMGDDNDDAFSANRVDYDLTPLMLFDDDEEDDDEEKGGAGAARRNDGSADGRRRGGDPATSKTLADVLKPQGRRWFQLGSLFLLLFIGFIVSAIEASVDHINTEIGKVRVEINKSDMTYSQKYAAYVAFAVGMTFISYLVTHNLSLAAAGSGVPVRRAPADRLLCLRGVFFCARVLS